jgi:circadian clock protein KaiC
MRSIGIDLESAVRRGKLRFHAERPLFCGLEMHLVTIQKLVSQFRPRIVVIDPISNFTMLGSEGEVKGMLERLIDFFKKQNITALFTSLNSFDDHVKFPDTGVSSLTDTWLLLRDIQSGAERNRVLHFMKSRGMAHSNQVREFLVTDHGVELRDVYIGSSGALLIGSARGVLEAQEKAQILVRGQEIGAKKRELERKRQAMETQIASLLAEFEVEQSKAGKAIEQDRTRAGVLAGDRLRLARLRQSGSGAAGRNPRHKPGESP